MSGVPYATLNDIVNGKTQLQKSSAETVFRIAQALNISMEDMIAPYMLKRSSFENFKSTICHRVKEMGDLDFIYVTLEKNDIRVYRDREWYPECLYLLGMLDYLSNLNDIPLCDEYEDLRHCKLEKPIFPSSIIALSVATKNNDVLEKAVRDAIPEFKRFNIIESEIRNVI